MSTTATGTSTPPSSSSPASKTTFINALQLISTPPVAIASGQVQSVAERSARLSYDATSSLPVVDSNTPYRLPAPGTAGVPVRRDAGKPALAGSRPGSHDLSHRFDTSRSAA